jgi:hypothetical protein
MKKGIILIDSVVSSFQTPISVLKVEKKKLKEKLNPNLKKRPDGPNTTTYGGG